MSLNACNDLHEHAPLLAINARDAMDGHGELSFHAGDAQAPDGLLPPGDHVRIAVTDSGQGMGPDVIAKVFEPFFTTKAVGKGTGLGLSQVYGTARRSGGAARILSQPGAGTTVEIWLPAAHGLHELQRARPDLIITDYLLAELAVSVERALERAAQEALPR